MGGSKDQEDMEAQVCPVQLTGAPIELYMDDSSMEHASIQPIPEDISIDNRD